MSAGKTLFTFVAGIASGLAIVYFADPKGSEKNIQKLDKELKKNAKLLDDRLTDYKKEYNTLVDKYTKNTKDIIESLKGSLKTDKNGSTAASDAVDKAKKAIKSS